jgi:integrase
MKITQPIRDKNQIRELAAYYLNLGQLRNHVLIVMGLYTALRVSDLLRLRWSDVYDFENRRVRPSITITEKKTGKVKTIALNSAITCALAAYAATGALTDTFVIANQLTGKAINRVQAYRLIRTAADALNLGRVSCHSLRKTFGYHAWKSGKSPAIIMEIYNHSSFEVTKAYLGITQDDMNDVYLSMDLTM